MCFFCCVGDDVQLSIPRKVLNHVLRRRMCTWMKLTHLVLQMHSTSRCLIWIPTYVLLSLMSMIDVLSPFFTCLNFSCCCKIQVRDYDWPLGPSSLNELFDWPKWNADRLIKSDFAPDVREMLSENLLRNIVIHDAYSGMGTAGYTLHLQHAHLCRDWFAIWSSQFPIIICHCLYPCFEFNCICHAFALHGIFAVFAGRYCD